MQCPENIGAPAGNTSRRVGAQRRAQRLVHSVFEPPSSVSTGKKVQHAGSAVPSTLKSLRFEASDGSDQHNGASCMPSRANTDILVFHNSYHGDSKTRPPCHEVLPPGCGRECYSEGLTPLQRADCERRHPILLHVRTRLPSWLLVQCSPTRSSRPCCRLKAVRESSTGGRRRSSGL